MGLSALKRVVILFYLLIGALSVVLPCSVEARQITGMISRPPESSTASAVDVDVSVFDWTTHSSLFTQSVQIPAGQMSTPFSLSDPANAAVGLQYSLRPPSTALAFLNTGYYNGSGNSTPSYPYMQIESGTTDIGDINFPLLPAIFISVTVALPNGSTTPATGTVFTTGHQYGSCTTYYQQSSSEFELSSIASESSYQLKVYNSSNAFCIGYHTDSSTYYGEGYIGTTGTEPFAFGASARSFSVTDQLTSLNIELIRGTTISGTISLPAGATTTETVLINMYRYRDGACQQWSNDYYRSVRVDLSPQQPSSLYSVQIPEGASACASYDIRQKMGGYVQKGYAATGGGTSALRSNARSVSAGSTDVELQLLQGVFFSGNIHFPDGGVLTGANYAYPTVTAYSSTNGQCNPWNSASLDSAADPLQPNSGSTNWSFIMPLEIENSP